MQHSIWCSLQNHLKTIDLAISNDQKNDHLLTMIGSVDVATDLHTLGMAVHSYGVEKYKKKLPLVTSMAPSSV